ncbi:MAG TPA: DUF4349 domain-containing protein [Gemmatimonadaceae bacterium]|nr:DUF4349 domain-containing protein [Gemmatimonadaceae bacterium]
MRWSKAMVVGVAAMGMVAFACSRGDNAAERNGSGVGTGGGSAAPASAPQRGMVGDVAARLREEGGMSTEPAAMTMADTIAPTEPPAAGAQSPSPAATTAMIIRTGTATIKVDSLEPAVARLRALATSVGGYVGNTSMQTGSDQLRSATVEIKVPAARWGQLVSGLKPIGTLESVQESAQDVGEEFVDVQARVSNAKRLEARLIDLLANRTGKLSDALQVERELARVREEIERYEGRIRYLRTQTAVSTMTVNVHEPLPVLGSHPGDNPIAQAFRDAWRIFVGVIAFLISSLGILIPLGILAWLVWMMRGRWRRKA